MKNTIFNHIAKTGILLSLFLLVISGIKANSGKDVSYYYQAEKFFRDGNYLDAAQAYEKYLSIQKEDMENGSGPKKKLKDKNKQSIYQDAVYHLAESYRLSHDYKNAEKYYEEAVGFKSLAYPELGYWYGVMLRANLKFDSAIKVITDFLGNDGEKGPLAQAAKKQLDDLHFIKSQLNNNKEKLLLEPRSFPGQASSYALAVEHGDTVAFTSIYTETKIGKNGEPSYSYHNKLYESLEGSNLMENKKLLLNAEDGMENGLACFSKDGKRMFFTKWGMQNGKRKSAIYTCVKSENGWSAPEKMGAPINMEGYDSEQPFLTSDSKHLLFCSDRPGGQGGYDIWFANLDNNFRALSASNMGNKINTSGDEASPFYHSKSHTLSFSSNGLVGMGGFDIYFAKGTPDLLNWETPVNPGAPINSVKDDLYYSSTDGGNVFEKAWLSSDRDSDVGLALYALSENKPKKVFGIVVDAVTKKPLSGVLIVVSDERTPKRILVGKTTDSQGRYEFELNNVEKFILHVEKDGFEDIDSTFAVNQEKNNDQIQNGTLYLDKPGAKKYVADLVKSGIKNQTTKRLKSVGQSVKIGNFRFKKTSLSNIAMKNLDSLASLMKADANIKVLIKGYSDRVGSAKYNLKLSQQRADACIDYLVSIGIEKDRLQSKGYGESSPIARETVNGKDSPEGRAKNRRVEYQIMMDSQQAE